MKYIIIVLLASAFILPVRGAEKDFSDKEKTVIYMHSLNMLKDYQRLINEIGVFAVNNLEAAQSSSESFLELFVNRQVLIYNDLDPAHLLSPFYEAETYISNLLLWYHDGMEIEMNFDIAKVSNIMEHEYDVYSLDIMINKQINGNYLNRTQNRNREALLFRIAFNTKGSGNYKIVGIRNASSEFQIDYSSAMEEVNSEVLKENEEVQVTDGSRALMNDYANFLSLLSDPSELEEDKVFYKKSFMQLFKGEDARVFNDLQPEPENSLLSTTEYLDLLKSGYEQGINNLSLNSDSARIGNVIKNEDESYYTSANVTKFFSGMYRGEEVFREMFSLNFKIVFEKAGSAYINYKIESIDIEVEDFYQSTGDETTATQLPEQQITSITRKGWSLSIGGSYGYSMIESEMAQSPGADYDAEPWVYSSGYGYRAGIHASYFFNDHIGLIAGLNYNNYQGSLHLTGHFEDTELTPDINGLIDPDEVRYKNYQMDYDSALSHSYISLPLLLNYTSGTPGKWAFYIEAGGSLGYRISSAYTVTGDEQFYGNYPYHEAGMELIYLEELGYYNRTDIQRSGDADIHNINISGYLSTGIVIPLGYFSSFKFGPEVYFGFTDINTGIESLNIFGQSIPHESNVLKKYGVKFTYVLKL